MNEKGLNELFEKRKRAKLKNKPQNADSLKKPKLDSQ